MFTISPALAGLDSITRLNLWPFAFVPLPLLRLLHFSAFHCSIIGSSHSAGGSITRPLTRSASTRVPEDNAADFQHLDPADESSVRGVTPTLTESQDPLYALLARLTDHVASSSGGSSSRNIRIDPPAPFSGTDRTRLRSFLNKLESIFIAQPETFRDDHVKITYAGTCLSDIAHGWYIARASPDHPSYDPQFTSSWSLFVSQLRYKFGSRNEKGDAELRLRNLGMESHHQCSIYLTKFEDISDILQWPDEPLMSAFKRGLPDRILDVLANRERKPSTLAELQDAALDIDIGYWEIQEFKKSRTRSSNTSTRSQSVASNTGNQQTSPSSTSTTRPPLSAHLTSDNKLTSEERTRRMRAGLCLFCGQSGHLLQNCEERKQREASRKSAQSRAMTAEEAQVSLPPNHSENY